MVNKIMNLNITLKLEHVTFIFTVKFIRWLINKSTSNYSPYILHYMVWIQQIVTIIENLNINF